MTILKILAAIAVFYWMFWGIGIANDKFSFWAGLPVAIVIAVVSSGLIALLLL